MKIKFIAQGIPDAKSVPAGDAISKALQQVDYYSFAAFPGIETYVVYCVNSVTESAMLFLPYFSYSFVSRSDNWNRLMILSSIAFSQISLSYWFCISARNICKR